MGRGFGIISTTALDVVAQIAAAAEQRGYSSLWTNDIPGGSGLEVLAAAAGATTTLRLYTGVLGVRRRSADEILREIDRLALPLDRLTIGLGTGGAAHPLRAIRETIEALRPRIDVPIIIAATGPKMRTLAGEFADGALFNWPIPETALAAREQVREAARRAGRPQPFTGGYIRCALMPQAETAMNAEIGHFAAGGIYAEQLAEFGKTARDAVIQGTNAADFQPGIAAFEPILDEVVVRAVTADETAASLLELLQAGAPPT